MIKFQTPILCEAKFIERPTDFAASEERNAERQQILDLEASLSPGWAARKEAACPRHEII
jgi:hypothetical protein